MLGFNDIHKGAAIVLDDEPYVVVASEFMRKQKTRPVMRTQLKSLRSGAVKEHSFQQSDKVAEADIERRECQFLYRQEETVTCMDTETYEQIELSIELVGDAAHYLSEGETVTLLTWEGSPVTLELPIKVDREVIEAPPGVKGDTSTNVMKEVIIAGGATVKAPLFVDKGDTIRIDTRTGTYVERV